MVEQYVLEMDSAADILTVIEQKGKSSKRLVETSASSTRACEEGQAAQLKKGIHSHPTSFKLCPNRSRVQARGNETEGVQSNRTGSKVAVLLYATPVVFFLKQRT
jgi:hypothetical protein